MGPRRSWYRTLQVVPEAEPEVIEAAYRRLARKYHPDVSPAPDAGERMRELNAAYEVLRDPARRAAYDRELAGAASAGRSPAGGEPAPRTWDAPHGTGGFLACHQHPDAAAVGTCGECGAGLCRRCFGDFQPPSCSDCVLEWAGRRRAELLLPAAWFAGVLVLSGGLFAAAAARAGPLHLPPGLFGWALLAAYVLASLPSGRRALGRRGAGRPWAALLGAATLGPVVAPVRMAAIVVELRQVRRLEALARAAD